MFKKIFLTLLSLMIFSGGGAFAKYSKKPEKKLTYDNGFINCLRFCIRYDNTFKEPETGSSIRRQIFGTNLQNICQYTETKPDSVMKCGFPREMLFPLGEYYVDLAAEKNADDAEKTYIIGDDEVKNPIDYAIEKEYCKFDNIEK